VSGEPKEAGGLAASAAARSLAEGGRKTRHNPGYLDEDVKRAIRRGLLKAVATPGYQVPFGGVEMPMPYGWGTGGVQVSCSLIGPGDVLKVIDQGADDTVNAVSLRSFLSKMSGAPVTTVTTEATIIQTRHRIPEERLRAGQIMVYQVPLPEPLRRLEPSETETRTLHALREYGLMSLRLYEDVARHGRLAMSFDHPCLVNKRHVMSPSPIPAFDNPKLHLSEALHLFGAGRERRLYAVPPHTKVVPLDFEDHPFDPARTGGVCAICGSEGSWLDEVIADDQGRRLTICSDTDFCARNLAANAAAGPGAPQ
jgi:alpha-D-ribose 1-methylphosphonate 5-phosphate C-P lyase